MTEINRIDEFIKGMNVILQDKGKAEAGNVEYMEYGSKNTYILRAGKLIRVPMVTKAKIHMNDGEMVELTRYSMKNYTVRAM